MRYVIGSRFKLKKKNYSSLNSTIKKLLYCLKVVSYFYGAFLQQKTLLNGTSINNKLEGPFSDSKIVLLLNSSGIVISACNLQYS